ncbi:hypothetical protein KR200_009291 [Drosophila serrata]|nr:hypothetical protein KR200_009291 [Drosophila serrata]
MHRSLLLLLMSALLLSAAVGLPLSLEESAEKSWLDLLLEDVWESEELLDFSHENSIHKRGAKDSSGSSEEHKDKAKDKANSSGSSSEEQKTTTDHAEEETSTEAAARRRRQTMEKRAAKDPSSSSEEHKDKDKANNSGESSSEEHKSTTQATARRRRSISPSESCGWLSKGEEPNESFEMNLETFDLCTSWLRDLLLNKKGNADESHITERRRRQVSGLDQQGLEKASGELELDAQAEKELDEEMARAVADVKDNGSIEDYAQGCEVMEVSSKEANEATYAE